MTISNHEPISESDITEYLKTTFDFGFELSVLELLRNHNIDCKHSGYYEDPVTKKLRQFDIRALKKVGSYGNIRVRMAIECKNFKEDFPILVSSVPRVNSESYHQIAVFNLNQGRARVISIRDNFSIYKSSQLVGKDTKQLKRVKDNEWSDNDKEIFDKISQCLNSSNDLISLDIDEMKDKYCFVIILPIVVVPNGSLWEVKYQSNSEISKPYLSDRCSLLVERSYRYGTDYNEAMILSHLEIMTFNGLKEFIATFLNDEDTISQTFFHNDGVDAGLKEINSPKQNF